jgi:hypothetical protein
MSLDLNLQINVVGRVLIPVWECRHCESAFGTLEGCAQVASYGFNRYVRVDSSDPGLWCLVRGHRVLAGIIIVSDLWSGKKWLRERQRIPKILFRERQEEHNVSLRDSVPGIRDWTVVQGPTLICSTEP